MSNVNSNAELRFNDFVGANTNFSVGEVIACTAFQDRDLTMVGAGTEVVVMGAVTTAKNLIIKSEAGAIEIRVNAEAAGHTIAAGGVYCLAGCAVTSISLVHAGDAHALVYMAGV
jgi:hypothetical protein